MSAGQESPGAPASPADIAAMPPALAEEAIEGLLRQGIPVDQEAWLGVAISYAASGDGTGAEHVLGRIVRDFPEAEPFFPAFRKLLACLDDKDIDAMAIAVVAIAGELATVVQGMGGTPADDLPALAALSRAMANDDAAEVERILRSDDLPAHVVTSGLNWLLNSALQDAAKADRMLDRMARAGIPVTADHWAVVIAAHDLAEGWPGALAAFERAKRRGIIPSEAMWKSLADSAASSQAPGPAMVAQVIDDAAGAGQPVTTSLWNALLRAYTMHEPSQAPGTFTEMAARGLAPDAMSWLFLAWAGEAGPGPRIPAALEAAVSAYERGLELSPHNTMLLAGLLNVAYELGRDDLASDTVRRFVQLASPSRKAGFETALRRLEPLLDPERAAGLIALLDRSPGNVDWPFRVFRDTLRTLDADYGTIAPLLMAFPDLMDDDDAYLVVERTTTGQRQDQALGALALAYPAAAHARAADRRARPRRLATAITGHDLLDGHPMARLEADARTGDFDAAEYLSFYEQAAGNIDRALEWIERLNDIDPVEQVVRIAIRELESSTEHRDEHLEELKTAVEQGNAGAAYYLGDLHASDGQLADAKIMWLRAAELGSLDAPGGLATLCVELRDDDDAERWARAAADLGDPEGFDVLGFLMADHGHLGDAERMYRQCLEAGGTVGARRRLAWVMLQAHRSDEAIAMLIEAADHGDVDAARDLCHLTAGDDETHRSWIRRAAELGDAESAATHGLRLLREGRMTEAEYWLVRGALRGAAVAGAGMAELSLVLGDETEAERWCTWTMCQRNDAAIRSRLLSAARRSGSRLIRRWQSIITR